MQVWSHSRLSSFEKCPLQYRFRYIDRIKRDTQGIEAFMGSRVHEALEHLYREVGRKKKPSVMAIVDHFGKRWAAEYDPKRIRIVRREFHSDDYRATGEQCLRDFHARQKPFTDGETLGLEEKFEFALDPAGRYPIMGYIDRIVRPEPGVYEVHDYKTAAWRPRDEDLKRDRQLTFYQMAVRRKYPDAREVRLVWHFLIQGERRTSSRSDEEVEAHRRQAIRLIDTIQAARDYPARTSPLCRWCEYRDICPAEKGRLLMEQAAENAAAAAAAKRAEERRAAILAAGSVVKAVQASLFSAMPASTMRPPAPAPPRPPAE